MTGFDPALVEDLLSISRELVSLDAPMLGDGSSLSSIGDFIEDDSVSPEDSLIDVALQEDVGKILESTLNEREREIIELRFGLNGRFPMSLKEIGELYNLTKERIRQIEKKALDRLKAPEVSKYVEAYIA